jgi:hypothetical protein
MLLLQVTTAGMRLKQSHRRPNRQGLDGPFPIAPGDYSTRVKQIGKCVCVTDSGLGPGEYNSPQAKDVCMRNAPGFVIGKASRDTQGVPHYTASLSTLLSQAQAAESGLECHSSPMYPPLHVIASTGCNIPQSCPADIHIPKNYPSEASDCGSNAFQAQDGTRSAESLNIGMKETDASREPNTGHMHDRRLCHLQKVLPPLSVARSAAHHVAPGDWDWAAVSRALCNTFTTQHGGAFRNDRAKTQIDSNNKGSTSLAPSSQACDISQIDANDCRQVQHPRVDAADCRQAHAQHQCLTKEDMDQESVISELPSHMNTRHQPDNSQLASKEPTKGVMQVDPSAIERHERARQAAEEVQAIQTRQRLWEVQSALLPFLKREAMQASSMASKVSWM